MRGERDGASLLRCTPQTSWIGFPLTSYLLLLTCCTGSLSPLSHKLKIGEEPYLVFAADGEGGEGDLFASPAAGAAIYQVTFTRIDERLPRLSPDGSLLAFVRSPTREDSAGTAVWVMNLLNGAERRITDPGAVVPIDLAWSADSRTLFLKTRASILAAPAPPSKGPLIPVASSTIPAADSALAVLIGDPAAAIAARCAHEDGVCVQRAGAAEELLERDASEPLRWGPDSIAYRLKGEFVVRPLAGGTTRTLRWEKPPVHPREPTYFGPR